MTNGLALTICKVCIQWNLIFSCCVGCRSFVLKCIVHSVLGSVQRFLVSYICYCGHSEEVLGSAACSDQYGGERSKNGCILRYCYLYVERAACT